ncbi:Bili [Drosophila busckii]|uniref:FERM domain-containing protein 8 n=1 Tax=Drosophila busckii TaxID=30019 RepID=A0A0M4EWJ5_DROBS|nr:FERM domain-containing protein 8 [Drosophila busckii]ALC47930.1 Bili [Drosophila busckii]
MDANQYYCRGGIQQSATSSQTPSTKMNYGMCAEYLTCSSSDLESGFTEVSREMAQRNNGSTKSVAGNRNIPSAYMYNNCNMNAECTNSTNSSNNAGNYINIMTVPLGTLQYNRKKLTTQDYQSRIYYNTTDAKSREDYYSAGNGKRLSTDSSSNVHPQYQHQQSQSQSQSQNIHHMQHQVHMSQMHQNPHNNYVQHNQQKTACSHSSGLDPVEDSTDCGAMYSNVNPNGRVVAATQTHLGNVNVAACDQLMPQSPVSLVPVNVPVPPVMYTVHRVVTTAQIQTAVGSTFASSASVSSVVSTGRNETDCMAASAQVPSGMNLSSNDPCNSGQNLTDINGLNSPSAALTNASFLPVQQKYNNSNDTQQNSKRSTNNSSSNYPVSAKSSALVSRALQNVIPTCVYLMSRVAVHMEIEGTAQCPSQVMLAAALGCEELGISNKLLAQSIFGLWMTSSLMEMQLKAHHCPYVVRVAWTRLLEKFSNSTPIDRKFDEPIIILKRNVFFSKRDEEKIKDHRIVELLYEEAKHYVLTGRYIMESVHSLMLGGIQARIELGPYNSHTHTVGFFRENQSRFLPKHVAKSSNWLWLPISQKNSAEIRLLEQFKRVPQSATTRKLMRKYLEFCWALPFYGAAFFHGQMEQPVRGIMSLVNHKDIEVLVAVNERGVFIIDCYENTLLLGLRYEDMSWDYAKPSSSDDPECLTCIFLQFDAVENGVQISKLVQVFSKQAAMIDALISHFTEQMRKRKQDANPSEHLHDEPNPIQNNGNGVLCNKLYRLTLASFDEEGRCIGQMGSLSISY